MPADDCPDRYVPSVDKLVELFQALWGFELQRGQGEILATRLREDTMLPLFTRLADALRDVPPIGSIEGWPPEVGRALRVVRDDFDGVTRSWGWERIAEPLPDREAYVKRCRVRFEGDVERPYYEAVVSIDAGWPTVESPHGAEAKRGRVLGYRDTMTREEGEARLPEAKRRIIEEPRFGECSPLLESREEDSESSKALSAIRRTLMGLVPDRVRTYDRGGGKPESPKARKPPANTPGPPASVTLNFAALADALRKSKKPTQARLVEFMSDKLKATVQDVAEYVHENSHAGDGTVGANVRRTNDWLAERGEPLSFRVASGYVFREIATT